MNILALETSCDETAVAIVKDGWEVVTNTIETSVDEHKKTGGIVPEVAARDAFNKILPAVHKTLKTANVSWEKIDALAVTNGPGLMGSLLVGIETAKTLAALYDKPLIPIHHIMGHICANRLERPNPPQFPALVLTVSGGHNDLVLWKDTFSFERIGWTIDDAAGEAFDKGARILGLPFPGGPEISRWAKKGNAKAFDFPRPMKQSPNYDFSFSGLKTALLYAVQKKESFQNPKNWEEHEQLRSDFCASYQEAICDSLIGKLKKAAKKYAPQEIHLSGGVSANARLREKVALAFPEKTIRIPKKIEYCTDNAAMIAGAAYWKWQQNPKKKWDWREVDADLQRGF